MRVNDETTTDSLELEPHTDYREYPAPEMQERARAFYEDIARRRSVRDFDSRPIPDGIIEHCLLAAGTAPSGANQQPWHFSVITTAENKRRIRLAAEAEEREFYAHRAPQEWLDALAPLGTDTNKPFLEEAPALIAIFAQKYGINPDGSRYSHYYYPESVGIATGFLITALHNAGLATLTHTPNPMKFLNEVCERPKNERATILLVVGYPNARCADLTVAHDAQHAGRIVQSLALCASQLRSHGINDPEFVRDLSTHGLHCPACFIERFAFDDIRQGLRLRRLNLVGVQRSPAKSRKQGQRDGYQEYRDQVLHRSRPQVSVDGRHCNIRSKIADVHGERRSSLSV